MPPLSDAIDQLYRAFAVIPKPRDIDGCPHCLDREEIDVMLSKSLRSITPRELAPYASSAFLTVGDLADYLYFLPRILEIAATEPSWWPDPEVTGRAIRTAKPETWTDSQRLALNGYLQAVVKAAIQSGEYYMLDSWLCAIARMGLDVRPYLAQVEESPAAVRQYYEMNTNTLAEMRLSNAFWELPCLGHDVIVEWLFST